MADSSPLDLEGPWKADFHRLAAARKELLRECLGFPAGSPPTLTHRQQIDTLTEQLAAATEALRVARDLLTGNAR